MCSLIIINFFFRSLHTAFCGDLETAKTIAQSLPELICSFEKHKTLPRIFFNSCLEGNRRGESVGASRLEVEEIYKMKHTFKFHKTIQESTYLSIISINYFIQKLIDYKLYYVTVLRFEIKSIKNNFQQFVFFVLKFRSINLTTCTWHPPRRRIRLVVSKSSIPSWRQLFFFKNYQKC